MDYQEEFKKVLLSSPHCILGKNGLTDEFIHHVENLLKKYKIIKIKALKSITKGGSVSNIASQLALLTNSQILDIRGKKIIICKIKNK
jgi:RNA-binding protein